MSLRSLNFSVICLEVILEILTTWSSDFLFWFCLTHFWSCHRNPRIYFYHTAELSLLCLETYFFFKIDIILGTFYTFLENIFNRFFFSRNVHGKLAFSGLVYCGCLQVGRINPPLKIGLNVETCHHTFSRVCEKWSLT